MPRSESQDESYQASPNNLEKAYEDLEKEIQEIKNKLQSSVGLSRSGGYTSGLGQSHGVTGAQRQTLAQDLMYSTGGKVKKEHQRSYGTTSQPLKFS